MERRDGLRAGAAVGFVLFALLAVDQVAHGPVYRLDFPVDAALTRLDATGWPIHAVGNALSLPGSGRVAPPLLVAATAILLWWRQRALAAWCLASGALVGLLNPWLKGLFARPLPPFIVDRFPHSYAFPSGHTMGAAGTVGIAILLVAEGHIARQRLAAGPARQVRLGALIAWGALSFLVGVGRVLAQHHWISDVLAAWAISAGLVCTTVLVATLPRGRASPAA
ncbi:MAG: undecaprenyl-diphosphatase [Thermoplasmata archaeon]|jgi:undecaprenyl-diphosphatase|nr:undecaprenyl-diphosphatase [Thermoplasmata archaeon]